MKRARAWVLIGIIGIILLGGCSGHFSGEKEEAKLSQMEYEKQMELAKTAPFERYPELITYTLAKMTGSNRSNMPDGDTYENNAYTRYLRNMLNVQNEDVTEEGGTAYDIGISMRIASGDLPDLMVVSDYDRLKSLVERDMIEDLTDAYENCTSDRIKDIYNSYDEALLLNITFGGKKMALPETNINDGPNLIWLRKDWMDKLGLKAPKTLSDVEHIISEFIEKDPGENGEGKTVGLVCDTNLFGESGYNNEYLLDLIFANFGAYPKQWIQNNEGEITYGSIEPQVKDALSHLKELYRDGILDNQFLLRTTSNIIELIQEGYCGSFFGAWWAGNSPLMGAMEKNPDVEWVPYLISTGKDGSTSYSTQNPSYKYVVVRKGYEHPEIAAKLISVMFDYIRYEETNNEEFIRYFQLNVDPTARPLAINVDYRNALSICYKEVSAALYGKKAPDNLAMLERSYYESCKSYIENPKEAGLEAWAAYATRIQAASLLSSKDLKEVPSLYFGNTETMNDEWWKLRKMENQAYLKIITGEEELSYFDEFVSLWREQGGDRIIEEVKRELEDQAKRSQNGM